MKIAAITDDGQTLSQHFGRARYFLVVTAEAGRMVSRELRDKAGHHTFAPNEGAGPSHAGPHGFDPASRDRHGRMLAAIADCQVLLAGGMGQGMYAALEQAGIRPILTAESRIEEAIRHYLDGTLEIRPDLAH